MEAKIVSHLFTNEVLLWHLIDSYDSCIHTLWILSSRCQIDHLPQWALASSRVSLIDAWPGEGENQISQRSVICYMKWGLNRYSHSNLTEVVFWLNHYNFLICLNTYITTTYYNPYYSVNMDPNRSYCENDSPVTWISKKSLSIDENQKFFPTWCPFVLSIATNCNLYRQTSLEYQWSFRALQLKLKYFILPLNWIDMLVSW